MTETAPVAEAPPKSRRSRRILSGVALVLACLGIVLSTIAVWTHQVALNTDRFMSLTGTVVADPAVTDPIAARISTQVVEAVGVGDRLAARLPDVLKPLAGTLKVAVRNAIDERLQVALQDPRVQSAVTTAMAFTHEHVVRLLRGETDKVAIVDGYLTLNVFPVVDTALGQLQEMEIIPADVTLPDLSDPEAPDVLAQRLESALGIDLPPTFGTVQLMPAEKLTTAQTVIKVFDLVVILLVFLTLLLVAAALWLARDRQRMLIYLGVGTIVAFLISRTVIRAAEGAIVAGVADPGVAGAVQAIIDTVLEDLRGVSLVIVILVVILTIAAYLWGRPAWVTKTASAIDDTAGRAGSAAGAAASAGLSGAADKAPDRSAVEDAIRDNRTTVERLGLGVIIFLVVWIALGFEMALLGAALVIGFEAILVALSKPSDGDATDGTQEKPPRPA